VDAQPDVVVQRGGSSPQSREFSRDLGGSWPPAEVAGSRDEGRQEIGGFCYRRQRRVRRPGAAERSETPKKIGSEAEAERLPSRRVSPLKRIAIRKTPLASR
jgi:hypothetical protein